MTPHFIRSFSPREANLTAGGGRVRVMAALGSDRGRYSMEVHLPTLAKHIEGLPRHIDTVALIDDPAPDRALLSVVDDMVAGFAGSEIDVLSRAVAVTEAVKRIEGHIVQEAVDRSRLVSVRPPEVIRRSFLQEALSSLGTMLWANPTEFVTGRGGRLALFEAPWGSWSRLSLEARMELWAEEASLRLGGVLSAGRAADAPATG